MLVLILVATLALAAGRPRQLLPHVWTVNLGICTMDYYSPPAQERFTVALACPGTDYIRLWPLPPVQPWSEEDGWPAPALSDPDLQEAQMFECLSCVTMGPLQHKTG